MHLDSLDTHGDPYGHRPLWEVLRLAGPTVMQMASYTVMQFIDTWMLSHGPLEDPTAAANAGMLAFSVVSFGAGVMVVINTLVSQNFGRGDFKSCGVYLWQGIWFSVFYALLLAPAIGLAGPMFGVFGHEAALSGREAIYFQIVLWATILKMVGMAAGQFLLAIDRAWQVFFASVIGVLLNAVAAWAMIFGHWGFTPGGVRAAAWAQNIGVGVEMLILIGFLLLPGVRKVYGLSAWRWRRGAFGMLLKLGLPSGLQFTADVLAWTLFMIWVVARFGTASMAATSFTFRYMSVSFMPALGVGTALTALVGRYIGRGRPDIARHRVRLGFWMMAAYMVLCGLAFYLFRHGLMRLFSDDPRVLEIGATLMIYAGIYQFFDAIYITYNGALRGAGDILFPALLTAGLCWGLTVGGGWLVARWLPSWGAAGPWTAAMLYGMILGAAIYRRWARGRWMSIRLETPQDQRSKSSASCDTLPPNIQQPA